MLAAMQRALVQMFNKFVDEQCDYVRNVKDANAKKGVVSCFRCFVPFVDVVHKVR